MAVISDNDFEFNSLCEYDENGSLLHQKNSEGAEEWHEYDKSGQERRAKYVSAEGEEELYEYDVNGHEIHIKHSDGNELFFDYDEKGNFVHMKHDDYEVWFEYDERGNVTHKWNSDGEETFYRNEYEFYPNGAVKSCKSYKMN